MNKKYEIVIIGGGPAGITSGIYALRAGTKTLVLDNNNSSLKQAKTIQNYYGIESISGEELLKKGINQYIKLGGEIKFDEVLKIKKDYETNGIIVQTSSDVYETKAVILCMGSPKKKNIKELENFENNNVSYCAICDGFFYKGKDVAVIGDGQFAVNECKELEKIANRIYLFTGKKIENKNLPKNVTVVNKKIKEYVGEEILKSIITEDNEEYLVDGAFVAQGVLSSFEICKQLGLLSKNGFVLVDKEFMTNVAGVFAAGDVIGGLLQISKAVSDGANAGLEAVRYVKIMEINK